MLNKIKKIFKKEEIGNSVTLKPHKTQIDIIFDKYINKTQQVLDDNKIDFLNHPEEHKQMMLDFSHIFYNHTFIEDNPQKLTLIKESEYFKNGGLEIFNEKFLYYNTHEALHYDWDLKDLHKLEDAYANYKINVIENDEERIRIENLYNKYKLLRKHYIILGNGRREWNKGYKIIGLLYPTTVISSFFYDDIIFISPNVAQTQFGTQDKLDIFDKEKNTVNTSKLYAYIATQDFSDLIIYQYDNILWSVWAIKNGQNICIGKDIFTNDEAQQLIQALLQDIEENTNNQDFNVTGTVHKSSFDKFDNNVESVPIGDKTFRIDMLRQYRSNIAKGSQKFARTINIRMLETGAGLRKVYNIGYYEEDLELIYHALRTNNHINTGCIVYAGAPSSGKSTSLYSLFNDLHVNYNAQVVTIDTSVEFEINGFRQISLDDTKRAANEEKRMTIEKVTNDMLKQYANAMMVGEVRDDIQIQSFIKAAERGRLMAATMHTNDVKSIFTVIENSGLKPYQYLPSLRLMVHHSLIPKTCKKCQGKGKVKKDNQLEDCEKCFGTGYDGRELIYEIAFLVPGAIELDSNPSKDFDKLVAEGKILYKSKKDIAFRKYQDGIISKEDYELFSGENVNRIRKIIEDTKIKQNIEDKE